MNNKKFFYVWNHIEKAAFQPRDERGIKSWLRCYLMFLDKLFELDESFPLIKKEKGKFNYFIKFVPLDITCNYSIAGDLSGFTFDITWNETTLIFEYDKKNKCEFDYTEMLPNPDDFDINKISMEEYKEVIKDKIVHPAIHCHIKDSIFDKVKGEKIDFPHDIRIGFSTKNPFLFLYQFAFQLWNYEIRYGDSNKKRGEVSRLTNIIIKNANKGIIPAGILFGISK